MEKINISGLVFLLITCAVLPRVKAQQIEAFKMGDRVVFLGNSITDGGHYHSNIWLYYITHFPNRRINCYNAGIGGDRVDQMNDRFEDDVLSKKPTVLTVTWGMNDSGYKDWWNPRAKADSIWRKVFEKTKTRYAALENKLKLQRGVKIIFIGGSPYDEFTTSNPKNLYPGKSVAFQQLIDLQEQAAKSSNYGFVNFNAPMAAINKREQQKDPAFSLTPNDRVHPDNDGHLVMAYLFLKAQGMANKPVADVEIMAEVNKLIRSVNCQVNKLSATVRSVSYDYTANSLPFPIDTVARGWGSKKRQSEALKVVPFMQDLNREKLVINGLIAGSYRLLIDGRLITTYTAKQLASGVNLAEQTNTPQYQQAIQLRDMNEERWEIERRFRMYAYVEFNLLKGKGLLFSDNEAAMDTLENAAQKDVFMRANKDVYVKAQFKTIRDAWQKEEDVLIAQIYRSNKPKTHHIEILPLF